MYGTVERASLVETYFEVNLQPREGELNIQIPPGIIVLQTNIPPTSKEPQISKYFFNLIQVYRGEIWRFKTNETIQVAFSYETEADKINKYMYNLN